MVYFWTTLSKPLIYWEYADCNFLKWNSHSNIQIWENNMKRAESTIFSQSEASLHHWGLSKRILCQNIIGVWSVWKKVLQLAKSSLIIHGGAYFSAVCGWKLIPISSPEAYELRECCGLLGLSLTFTFCCFPQFALPMGCSRHIFKRICSKLANMDLSQRQFCISFVFRGTWLIRPFIETNNRGGNVFINAMN